MPTAKAKEKVRALVAAQLGSASYFLKIDGIRGESQDRQHRDEIELQSFAWGNSNAETQGGTVASTSAKVTFQDFQFVSPASKAGPQLMVQCATGKHIPRAVMTGRREGGGNASTVGPQTVTRSRPFRLSHEWLFRRRRAAAGSFIDFGNSAPLGYVMMTEGIQIQVNGEQRDCQADASVGDLLRELAIKTERVAVELNLEILDRKEFDQRRLKQGDRVEILSFIGGGL